MKVDVTENGVIRLKGVYNSIILETQEGNQFPVCMRDDGLEIGVLNTSVKHDGPEKYFDWFSVSPLGVKQLHPCSAIEFQGELEDLKSKIETHNQQINRMQKDAPVI